TRRVYDQLLRLVPGRDRAGDAELLQAVLAAFPDRVGRVRGEELLLSSGGAARTPPLRAGFVVALDVEERQGSALGRLIAPIEPEWLLDRAVSRDRLEWNRSAERVERVSALVYDQLVIEETRAPAEPSEEADALLAERALEADIGRFADRDELDQLRARMSFC